MLNLDRKPGQALILSGGIKILICEILPGKDEVTIGIEAPRNIKIRTKNRNSKRKEINGNVK